MTMHSSRLPTSDQHHHHSTTTNNSYSSSPLESQSLLSSKLPPFQEDNCRCRIYLIRHGETDWNEQGKIQGGGYDIPLNETGKRQAHEVSKLFGAGAVSNNTDGVSNLKQGILLPADLIVSSHLQRAHETADIIYNAYTNNGNDANTTDNDNGSVAATYDGVPRRHVETGFGEMRFGILEGVSIRSIRNKINRNSYNEEDQYLLQVYETCKTNMLHDWTYKYPSGGDSNVDGNNIGTGGDGESIIDVQRRSLAALYDVLQTFPLSKQIVIVSHGRTIRILLATLFCDRRRKHTAMNDDANNESNDYENRDSDTTTTSTEIHILTESFLQRIDKDDFYKKQKQFKQSSTFSCLSCRLIRYMP